MHEKEPHKQELAVSLQEIHFIKKGTTLMFFGIK